MRRVLLPSEPLDGERPRRLALAVVGGARPCGDRHLSAIARLQGFSSCSPVAFPHQWAVWWREASRAAASAPPSASRIFVIRAEAEEHTEWGVASAWAGNPFLPPAFGGERHPPAPRSILQPCGGRRTAASQPGCSIPSSVRAMVACRTRGSHNTSHAARAVLVFWDGPILVLVARTRVRTRRCPLVRCWRTGGRRRRC
jgi:hypothetical protein